MKKSCLKSLLLIVFVIALNQCGVQAFQPLVPSTTMQIAKEVEARTAQPKISSELVRVGIGTTGFSNYEYNEIKIYGTDDIEISNDGNFIVSLPAHDAVKIRYANGIYVLYDTDNKVIDNVMGDIRIKSEDGLLGVVGLKRAGKTALYRGEFELIAKDANKFNLVNILEVEEYLRGVVPNEMPVRFGLEALKAQSVAARNYVLSPRVKSSPNYDVVDSVASQVYFGANTETKISDEAVLETTGIVALYDWDLILAQYSSTAGGYSESFSYAFSDPKTKEFPSEGKPYLIAKPDMLSQKPLNKEEDAAEFYKSKPDSYDVRSPYFRWTKEWDVEELRANLEETLVKQSATGFVTPEFKKEDVLGEIISIEAKKRGESGKIVELDIITKDKTYKVFKELVIRRLFVKDGKALQSANVVFEQQVDENGKLIKITAYGGGYGHGVGMSQFGAGFMGEELKFKYDKILQHYYTGITLATKPVIISGVDGQQEVSQQFYSNGKYGQIIVDNKFQVNKLIAVINEKEQEFELCKGMLAQNRICRIDIEKYLKKGINNITFKFPIEEGDKKALRLFVEVVKSEEPDNVWKN